MKVLFSTSLLLVAAMFSGCQERFYEPDLTPPSAPQGLSTQTGDQVVRLFWERNPESDVSGYNVYVSSSYSGHYSLIGSTTSESYADNGIQNGRTYYYAVTAYDNSGNESELSHDLAFETPRPEGFGVVLKNYRIFPEEAGYDFSTYSVGPYNDQYTDVFFEYFDGVFYLDVWDDSEIQDVGYTNTIYEIGAAPIGGWSPTKDVRVILGHTYVVRTWDDHYAKVRVSKLSSTTMNLDWAFQLQQNNTEFKMNMPASRGSLKFGNPIQNR